MNLPLLALLLLSALLLRAQTGVAVAITFQGRLIYARGFGFADRDTKEPVQPDSLFRVASLSKPITGLALLRLLDQGKLSLDDRPFANQLRNLPLPRNGVKNAAWDQVTVRQLLQHTAGMPPSTAADPLHPPEIMNIALSYGATPPGNMAQALGTVLTRAPLSAPGSTYLYSNIGIGAIGRLIETVSGKPYDRFVQEELLIPHGITRMAMGASLRSRRLPAEVRHHDAPGTPLVQSIFPNVGMTELANGGYAHEAYESAGAWLASPIEVLRLFTRFNSNNFISADSVAEIVKRPPAPLSQTVNSYYGLAMQVTSRGNGRFSISHLGSLPGTRTHFVRSFGGSGNDIAFALFFNMRRSGDADFMDEAVQAIDRAAATTGFTNPPAHDLWPLYIASERPQFTSAGIVSAASFRAGAVSPGQIVTLFGDKLGGATLTTAAVQNNRLTTSLNATRVLFDGVPAPLVYTSSRQISAIVPYSVSGRATTRITIEYQGAPSLPVDVPVVAATPAFFTANSSGAGPAAAIRYPEARIAVLYATGEGLLTPTPEDGALSLTTPLPAPQLPVKVFLGGREVPLLFAGAAPGLTAGLLQLNIQIPEDLAATPNLPLLLEVGGTRSPPGVTF